MIEFEIDNKKVEVAEGGMIIEAADAAGIYIPRFCYHKKLTIAANCRMCLVEVEKSKKPLPACATPAMAGMKVFTQSSMAVEAQKSVMEFLLINHPLDCPICDQGGECELQDLSLGYGNDISRYYEGKRSVFDENLGPLISTEMTRCIQCTRCVRFGSEVAGMRELGATQRGENLEITTYVNHTMQSELSGNIIDLCPVGALTSKPYRFSARAWELKQHLSVSPHDCVGSNLFVHTRGYEYNDYRMVMRVVPRENETINETWLSDRDRFSYEAVRSTDRLLTPKIKRESEWVDVDWTTALNFVAEKWRNIIEAQDVSQIAALASPNSTVEEFFLLQKLLRGLGSNNLDHRIRQLDFSQQENYPSHPELGVTLPALEKMETFLIIGSDVRREQPLACHRIRKAALKGAQVTFVNPIDYDLNFEPTHKMIVPSHSIPRTLAGIAKYLLRRKSDLDPFLADIEPSKEEMNIAKKLRKNKGIILLGIHAITHPQATLIRVLAQQIAGECIFDLGCLSEGANAAGGWLSGMLPHRGPAGTVVENPGFNASEMFSQRLKSYLLLNIEPELDCANSMRAMESLTNADFVVAMSPFMTEAQEQYAHVLLPIAPFFETAGTLINAANCWQFSDSVTRPMGDAKPAWKVLRVLGNLFELEGFDYVKPSQITKELESMIESIPRNTTSLTLTANQTAQSGAGLIRFSEWPMYQIDNLVRRATSLQEWSQIENQVAIRINSKVAREHDFQSGEIISVIQDESLLDLPVIIDDRIAGDYVVVPVGISETAGFGENMGQIKLLRGRSK
ncbi:MAG: NADH-quinone oxidoreductase subunit G [Gammaproteobacteria bacterium]|nr:NADH-quinone oxidoreductase subunit G [Gammaproteobacteria bacterium]